MSASPSSSVKLSSGWVNQARGAASSMRRSVAGKIGYWATLGRIAEASGLTVSEAREAIGSKMSARQPLRMPTRWTLWKPTFWPPKARVVWPKPGLGPKRLNQPSRPRRGSRSSGLA